MTTYVYRNLSSVLDMNKDCCSIIQEYLESPEQRWTYNNYKEDLDGWWDQLLLEQIAVHVCEVMREIRGEDYSYNDDYDRDDVTDKIYDLVKKDNGKELIFDYVG